MSGPAHRGAKSQRLLQPPASSVSVLKSDDPLLLYLDVVAEQDGLTVAEFQRAHGFLHAKNEWGGVSVVVPQAVVARLQTARRDAGVNGINWDMSDPRQSKRALRLHWSLDEIAQKLVFIMRLALKFQEVMTAWEDDDPDNDASIQRWNRTFARTVGAVLQSQEGAHWWNLDVVSGTKGAVTAEYAELVARLKNRLSHDLERLETYANLKADRNPRLLHWTGPDAEPEKRVTALLHDIFRFLESPTIPEALLERLAMRVEEARAAGKDVRKVYKNALRWGFSTYPSIVKFYNIASLSEGAFDCAKACLELIYFLRELVQAMLRQYREDFSSALAVARLKQTTGLSGRGMPPDVMARLDEQIARAFMDMRLENQRSTLLANYGGLDAVAREALEFQVRLDEGEKAVGSRG